jgi:hypothetical protein
MMLRAGLGEYGLTDDPNQVLGIYEAIGNRAAANNFLEKNAYAYDKTRPSGRFAKTLADQITEDEVEGAYATGRINSLLNSKDPAKMAIVQQARDQLRNYFTLGQNKVLGSQTDWRGFDPVTGEPSTGAAWRNYKGDAGRVVPGSEGLSMYNTFYNPKYRPDLQVKIANLQGQRNAIWGAPLPASRPSDTVLAQVQIFTDDDGRKSIFKDGVQTYIDEQEAATLQAFNDAEANDQIFTGEDGRRYTESDGARRYVEDVNPLDTNQTAGNLETANSLRVYRNDSIDQNTVGDDYDYTFNPSVTPGANTGLGVSTFDPSTFRVYRNDAIDQNAIQQNQLATNASNWQQDFNNVVGGQFNMSNPGLVGGYNSSNIGGFDYSGLGGSLGNVGATPGFGLNTNYNFGDNSGFGGGGYGGGGYGGFGGGGFGMDYAEGGPVDLDKILEGQVAQAEALPPEMAPADVEMAPLEAIKAASAPVNPRAGTGIGGALSRIGQGISDYVTANSTPSPRELLEARMSEQARSAMDLSGLALPDRAVDVKADEFGSYPVDAEGNRLKFLRRSLGLPMVSGEGEARLAMPGFIEMAGNLMSGVAPAVKGSGMVLGSGPVRRGAQAGTEGAEAFVRELSPVGLYSYGEEVASSLPQARGTPEQFAAMLAKQGVKPVELEGFQSTFAGKPQVTKDEAAAYFKDSLPQIERKVLGQKENTYPYSTADEWQNAINRAERQGNFDESQRLTLAWEEAEGLGGQGAPKYQKYTLPGGENYREVLLKTPDQSGALRKETAEAKSLRTQAVADYANAAPGSPEAVEAQARIKKYTKIHTDLIGKNTNLPPEFRSSHWDDPNVLAHIRMADRTGPNNEKILHVEEIQSDWGQKGKKEGFKQNLDPKIVEQAQEKLDDAGNALRNHLSSIGLNDIEMGNALAEARSGRIPSWVLGDPRNEHFGTDYIDAMRNRNNLIQTDKPPAAPYVTNTAAWTDLALKDILTEAAKGGYDKVVWTPGAEQAKRYDLSKQISRLVLENDPAGGHKLRAYSPSGDQVINKRIVDADRELPDLIGKDVAKKLLDQDLVNPKVFNEKLTNNDIIVVPKEGRYQISAPWGWSTHVGMGVANSPEAAAEYGARYFSNLAKEANSNMGTSHATEYKNATRSLVGQDLSVGGEGMKTYYDKIVPNQLSKLLKKLDPEAKIEKGRLPVQNYTISAPDIARELGMTVDEVAALPHAEKMELISKVRHSISAPSITITPKMRENILKGQAAYAEGGEVNFKKMFEGDSEAMQERARELAREAYSKGYSSLGKKKADEWETLARKYNLPLSVGPFDNYEDQYSDAVGKWQRGLSPKQRVQTYDEGGPVKATLAEDELTNLQKMLAGSNPAANIAPFELDLGGGSQARGRVVQAGPYIDIGGGITLPLRDVMLMLDASYGKVPGTNMKPNISVKGGLRIPFAEGGAVTPYNADEIANLANQIYEGTNG